MWLGLSAANSQKSKGSGGSFHSTPDTPWVLKLLLVAIRGNRDTNNVCLIQRSPRHHFSAVPDHERLPRAFSNSDFVSASIQSREPAHLIVDRSESSSEDVIRSSQRTKATEMTAA